MTRKIEKLGLAASGDDGVVFQRGPSARVATVTEAQLQDALVERLRWDHWRVVHHWLSIRTAPGWPDLFAVKGSRLLAIECKSDTGVVTPAQREWLEALAVAGVECAVIRPADWLNGAVDAWLADPAAKPALPWAVAA